MQGLIDEGRVVLGRYNVELRTWTVNLWVRKAASRKLKTVWWNTIHDAGTHGTTLLNKTLGRRDAFPFPKSVYAVREAIAAVVRNRPNALVLDFFAGSGTTLHAVAMLNASDGGKRQCILVTNNEVSERRAQSLRAAGILPGSEEWEREGICRAVTWPRCKAVIEGKRESGTPLDGEWLTGRLVRKELPRIVRALSFTTPELLAAPAARRALAVTLGIRQAALAGAERWYIAPREGRDPSQNQAVLFVTDELEAFGAELASSGAYIRTINLVMPEDAAFRRARRYLAERLSPVVELIEATAPMSDGFEANLDYLRLSFVDPNDLELGGSFNDLLPALWMMSGGHGLIPKARGSEHFIFPEGCTFAVLLRESAFRAFNSKLRKAPSVSWVFIVTDSREAFVELNEHLPSNIPLRQRIHLYRNYVDNFLINRGTDEA
jgi:adenine-specific DNA-methyltransferase